MTELSAMNLILGDKLAPIVLAWWEATQPDPENPDIMSLCRVTRVSEEEVMATVEACQLAGAILGSGISDSAISWLETRAIAEIGKLTGRRVAARDDDKRQARRRVQTMIKRGDLLPPADVICMDCKNVPAREYDHYLGYAPEHHEHVQALCSKCHHEREDERLLDADVDD